MQFFDELLGQRRLRTLDNHINAAKMVGSFNDIVYIENLIFNADGIGFKNISRLIVGQTAPFHVVGVVSQIDLCLVINTTRRFTVLLILQNFQQGSWSIFSFVGTLRFLCTFGNVPSLSGEKCSGYPSLSAVVTNAALRDAPLFCCFGN